MKLRTKINILIVIILTVGIIRVLSNVYDDSTSLYNQSLSLKTTYAQKVQEQVSVYDANYLTFIQKAKIADISKETFITVTQIIMENRKDGQAVAWKWMQENQQIPYNEFTSFYHELSDFVSEQYSALLAVEKQKQDITAQHNLLIRKYPNNIYNTYLKLTPIEYHQGYVSDSTRKLFNLK